MLQLYIKRKFAAAHFLPGYPGSCSQMHGHTWLAEVWLEGEVDPKTGMVVDFKKIKDVIDYLDHRVLNEVIGLQDYMPPTAENLVKYFLRHTGAYRVRVWESDDCFAEGWADAGV